MFTSGNDMSCACEELNSPPAFKAKKEDIRNARVDLIGQLAFACGVDLTKWKENHGNFLKGIWALQ